jgi:hypothetical protein
MFYPVTTNVLYKENVSTKSHNQVSVFSPGYPSVPYKYYFLCGETLKGKFASLICSAEKYLLI